MQDISFLTDGGRFNLRVGCVLLDGERLLVMQDGGTEGYYLPGGRLHFGETFEEAALREMREELGIAVRTVRPLWIKQGFFNEFSSGARVHEISLYYLLDASGSDLLSRGDCFVREEEGVCHRFRWVNPDELREMLFFPNFLKTALKDLPNELTLCTEIE